jgi:hypothetical protein
LTLVVGQDHDRIRDRIALRSVPNRTRFGLLLLLLLPPLLLLLLLPPPPSPPPPLPILKKCFFLKTRHTTHPSSCDVEEDG